MIVKIYFVLSIFTINIVLTSSLAETMNFDFIVIAESLKYYGPLYIF